MAAEEEEAARARQRLEDMGIDVNAVNEIKLKEKNTCSADEKNAVPRLAALRLGEGGVSGELVELAAAVAAAAEEDFGTLVDDASATSAEGDRSKAFGECMSRVRCGLDAATLAGTGDELLSALTYLHRHISTITAATSMSAPSDACGGSGGGGNEGARGAMSFLETLHGIIDVIQTNRLAELRRCAPSHGTAPEGDTKEMGDAGNGACASGATPGFSHLQDSFKALKKLLNVREEGDKVGITRACAAMESIRTELRSRGLGKRKAKDVDDVAMTEATSDAAAQGSGRDELNALVKRSDMSASDLEKLRKIDTMLRRDYSIRREMLVRRLGVTLQSFLWSKRIKGTEKEASLEGLVRRMRDELNMSPANDLLESVFTSEAALVEDMSARTVTRGLSSFDAAVKHVRIGPVPDRGGRPGEARSVRDMPSFKPRQNHHHNNNKGDASKHNSKPAHNQSTKNRGKDNHGKKRRKF